MMPGELQTQWMPVELALNHLQLGDLVEFRRNLQFGVYTHWAIYIGRLDGIPRVVHISTEDGDFGTTEGENKFKDSLNIVGSKATNAAVRCDTVEEVAGTSYLRINNGLDASHRPFPPAIAVERATNKLGEGNYNVVFNNCEHFVKWCRYGNRISSQAIMAKGVALSSLLMVGMNPLAALGAGVLFTVTAEPVSRYLHRTFGSNGPFSFF